MEYVPDFTPTGIEYLDIFFSSRDPEEGDGAQIWRFIQRTSRYFFDRNLALGPAEDPDTWTQFDTASDASIFGVWIHRHDRMILEFAEGDLTLTVYDTPEAYDDALVRLCRLHDTAPAFTVIDPGTGEVTRYFEARRPFFHDSTKLDVAEAFEDDRPAS